jgi:hypothetical protein
VEHFENGRLFDIRVFQNPDYNPEPGARIEDVYFKDIAYNGTGAHPSQIFGYDESRMVENVVFENLQINGNRILDTDSGNIRVNAYAGGIRFK